MTKLTWGFSGKEATLEQIVSQVGAGWQALVVKLIEDLLNLGWDGRLFQIKEKFGTLRFYIGGGNDTIYENVYKRIEEAGRQSAHTCELCGEPGKLYYDGWVRCLCPKHAREQGREDYEPPNT